MHIEVTGFFDDRSGERLGIESGCEAHRRAGRTRQLREAAPHGHHIRRPADPAHEARDGSAGRPARHHRLDLLRAGHLRVRSDPGALGRDSRHSGGRHVRDAVLRLSRRRQAADRHRPVGHYPAAAAAAARAHRRAGEALLARAGDLQTAPLRARRPGNRGLQVPHHEGDRGRSDRSARRRRAISRITPHRRHSCGAPRSTNCRSSSTSCRAA